MKGILICGGKGERLFPVTKYINKHLLLIYNKPMFFYPLSVLLLSGCDDILIVGNKKDFKYFDNSISQNLKKKIKIRYVYQSNSDGIASAIGLTSKFFKKDEKGIFILGDNFFYGNDFIKVVRKNFLENNSHVFLSHALDPWNYGTLSVKKKNIKFFEKKKNTKQSCVVTGLYIFNKESIECYKKILKSSRGEYEITDMLNEINKMKKISIINLGRGVTWYDMGTFKNINKVSNFVEMIESRQGLQIGNLKYIP